MIPFKHLVMYLYYDGWVSRRIELYLRMLASSCLLMYCHRTLPNTVEAQAV